MLVCSSSGNTLNLAFFRPFEVTVTCFPQMRSACLNLSLIRVSVWNASALAEQKDQYLRLMAEYQNYRNRTTEEKKKIYGDAKADCVLELLTVMDTFERALAAECADEAYKKGVELTFGQLQKAMEKLGVTEIEALGKPFDPNVHNAIKQVDDSDYASDTVCEVFQKGYMLGERLIRPVMVAVSV